MLKGTWSVIAMVATAPLLRAVSIGGESDGCSTTLYSTLNSTLRKHMNIHDRPYKCPVTSCMSHSDGFATKGVLDRHKAAKHPNLTPRRGKKEYYCPQQGCHRSIASPEKNPFKRKDHLHEHIKRIHNNFVTQAPVPFQNDPLTRIIRDQRASAVGDETGEYIVNNHLHTTTARLQEKRHEEDVVAQASTATSTGEECCRHGKKSKRSIGK